MTLNCRGTILSLETPIVMGILNVNEDSFYRASCAIDEKAILTKVTEMIEEGAHILDIGAVSSRPGALDVPMEVELNRINSALRIIKKELPDVIISVDTFRSQVALQAIGEGASMINDISSGSADPLMFDVLSGQNIPFVMMHMQGNPKTMQVDPSYDNVSLEVLKYFVTKIDLARKKGIQDIIIDPGFGFGKTLEHNYQLLASLSSFSIFDLPILVGISRKSIICKVLNISSIDALNGTTSLHMYALMQGANILRVHDVKEAVECVKIFEKIKSS